MCLTITPDQPSVEVGTGHDRGTARTAVVLDPHVARIAEILAHLVAASDAVAMHIRLDLLDEVYVGIGKCARHQRASSVDAGIPAWHRMTHRLGIARMIGAKTSGLQ